MPALTLLSSLTVGDAGLGGHMNMKNFITGFSGHEHEHRAAMLQVLGPDKYDFFFDKVSLVLPSLRPVSAY